MANNNFPPGMPFPFPFPQMQQPPHTHGAQQDAQSQAPPPPPPPGWNLPGLQQYPPQPHTPQPAHVENQHNLPPFPSSGISWPPQIPPEWLQLMQNSMQSGMIPPPLPGLNFPPPSLPHTPQAPATPISFPPQFTSQPVPTPAQAAVPVAPVERVQEVMESDREDGEVSDADGLSRAPPGLAGIAMRQRYEPPRSAPPHAEDGYNPEKPSAGQTKQQPPPTNGAQQSSTVVNHMELLLQQREEARQFIRLLNANNIGYHALAKENIDVELLRSLYRSMNLPSEPEPIPPPPTKNGVATTKPLTDNQASTATPNVLQKAAPSVSTNIAVAANTSAAPSPVDRKDYLARLQAAKLARQTGPAKASPPQKSPSAAAASPATGVSTPTKKPPVTDEQKARQTELIKQRLEALKAQSKQNAVSSNSATPKLQSSQPNSQQPRTTGPGSVPASQFPSIPGLFMGAPPNTNNGASTPSQPQAVSQKRPAPSDTTLSTPRGSVTPYNRQFGQSPHTNQEDSMIIEVSEDESNGSEMDIDDDQAPSGSSAIRQPPASVPGFPSRQAPVPTAASAVSTPGPQTPATLARTGELSTKEQELAALKLTLKKKLAEQKRIKEAAEAASAAAAAAATSTATPQENPMRQQEQAGAPVALLSKKPTSGESSRDRKRRRRTEIQEQLPTLDDEIASNEAEMARLAKDLERLKANNERIMQDKERLTRELEDLGIDTEGMSHADMQATKDEIERAQSPEKASASQDGNATPQEMPLDVEFVDKAGPNASQTAEPVSSPSHPPRLGFLPGLGQPGPVLAAPDTHESVPLPAKIQFTSALPSMQPATADIATADTRINTANDRASATPMDDDEDFYSPPPVEVEVDIGTNAGDAQTGRALEPQIEQNVAESPSPSEEGEVEMSESSEDEDEEEYEPEEPGVEVTAAEYPAINTSVVETPIVNEFVAEPALQQASLPQPPAEQSHSIGQSQVSTEDEEPYEPPDVDEEMGEASLATDVAQSGVVQPEASSPGDADDGAMDIATSSDESSDDSESESESESEGEGETQSELGNTNVADDLAPELQPETPLTIIPATEQPPIAPAVEEEPKLPAFTPYESPLRMFKSYRYHPNFSQDVNGGFLSMTYSHQIDSDKPLCPFESAGGSCNDPECPNQHFRGMGVTGEKLLVQLGTANPGKTQAEKQQWNDGLRSVLKDLRQQNIKDPNGIAQEIAKYRRRFFNDDTRVVNL